MSTGTTDDISDGPDATAALDSSSRQFDTVPVGRGSPVTGHEGPHDRVDPIQRLSRGLDADQQAEVVYI